MTNVETDRKREDVMRKVRAMLDKADSTGFTPEADAFRQKAHEMMETWAIEEWHLQDARPAAERMKPVLYRFVVSEYNSQFQQYFIDLAAAVALHARCRCVFYNAGGKGPVSVGIVGFKADTEYAELLFTSLRLAMAMELEPRPQGINYLEDLARLKEAGLKWERVYSLLRPVYPAKFPNIEVMPRPVGVRFTKEYTNYCEQTGRTRSYISPVTFQRNFSNGFVTTVNTRMAAMRRESQRKVAGTELALVDREKEVRATFQEHFPQTGTLARRGMGKFEVAATLAGQAAGQRADLSGGTNQVKGNRGEIK